ncbi:glutamyl-Q tRNA(Asp) synthetase [Bifidobacterium sp. ESL0732]|uniref:glutamyl-Q tRNA(Asp) synthetase n=1 Tax=Bifidobacterium sp. ESL0732 TaxID=2983222 RepID=UPI0023F918B0|nr:glutamyl-Q tRNA(Asp) synthetase [Bifidobacterium sp. ESL0732]WEV64231.1 glutamyl-Q tRNA(Asp) synthetase [Bifidobacterium sp. ESL0732]
MSGRVGRFAPTPSGRMHIGNIYAMLAAWLSAHAGDGSENGAQGQQGKVLLRIEDVDGPRAVKDADKWIMDDLHWLGLDWDGEPVYQSQRTEIYEEALRSLKSVDLGDVVSMDVAHAGSQNFSTCDFDGSGDVSNRRDRLQGKVVQDGAECSYSGKDSVLDGPLASGDFPLVYPCFCSRADLRAALAPQEGDRFLIYPGTCRNLLTEHPDEVYSRLEAGKRHSWRIAVPEEGAPESIVTFDDRIFGRQRFDLPRRVGDTVIRRSDGIFSYQLAVVVDDLLMGVNDIVRGRDLLRSTALQIWIRRALVASGFPAKYGIAVKHDSNESNNCNTLQLDNTQFVDNRNASKPNDFKTCKAGSTAGCPAYAHLPLIDDPTGVRLAKRKRSLDIGTLRAAGVKPEQIIGYCAWLLGIRAPQRVHMPDASEPVVMSAREALQCFTWRDVHADKSDRILAANWANEFDRHKSGSVA